MKYKLSDVVDRINGNVDRFTTSLEYYVGGEHFESNELEITGCGLIKPNVNILGFKFHFAFQPGDVLYMARNPHLRKAGMVNFSGICSDASYILRTKDSNVLCQEYLAVIMQSNHLWDYCESHKVGSVNFAINWKTLANYEFDLPDINIQRSIANRIWAAYRVKQAYKKLISATDEMVKSRFLEMFGNPFEESDDKVKLGTLCEINPTKPKGLSDDLCVSFIPMDKVNEDGTTSRFEVRSLSEVKKGFTYCQDNDVLFAKITPCMENGKGAVMTGLSNRIGFGSTEFHVLRPKEGVTTPIWLYHLTKMDLFRLDAAKNMTGTGGQKRVPTQYLENFMVSTPSFDLQNQFMELASQADKSKFELKRAIEAIDKVIKSLING